MKNNKTTKQTKQDLHEEARDYFQEQLSVLEQALNIIKTYQPDDKDTLKIYFKRYLAVVDDMTAISEEAED